MTKKELELENNYLKLRLKTISTLVSEVFKNPESFPIYTGKISFYSDEKINENNLKFLKERNLPYNFFED